MHVCGHTHANCERVCTYMHYLYACARVCDIRMQMGARAERERDRARARERERDKQSERKS
jgi:hypothetical protein